MFLEHRKNSPHNSLSVALPLVLSLLFFVTTFFLYSKKQQKEKTQCNFYKFPLQTFVSQGHQEFGWTLIALDGLASTVNAWNIFNSANQSESTRSLMLSKFEDFLDVTPELAKQSLGMRELFLFPTSFLAFEINDIDRAILVARAGAADTRIEADLSVAIAYLSHIFKGDLAQAAKDYERVYMHFPNAQWLKSTIDSLKSGVDPYQRAGRERSKTCIALAKAFPLAKKRLIERGVCTTEQLLQKGDK